MQLLKPSSFTPILALVGIILYMFCKSGKKKDTGTIFLGFATLMFGMETMTGAVAGLKNDPQYTQLYISFTNFTSGRKLNKVGNLFQTSKGEGHGFGLVRIDNIIERLGGYLSRNSEDGAFTTEILIPQT